MRFSFIVVAMLFALFSFSFLADMSSAQLGEVAGEPTFYVNISSTYTYNYTFINQGSDPIPFRVIIDPLRTTVRNSTLPIVTASPMSGSIPPKSKINVKVSVFVPAKNNTPGMKWQGVLEVVVNSTSNFTGGAVIQEGVAKIITIIATPAKPNSNYLIYEVAASVAVGSATAGGIIFLYAMRRRKAKAVRPSEASVSKKPAAVKATARKPSKQAKGRVTRKKTAPKRKRTTKARSKTKGRVATRKSSRRRRK